MKRKYQQTLISDGRISIRKNSQSWNVYLTHSEYLNYTVDLIACCNTKRRAVEIANELFDYHTMINNIIKTTT